MQFQPKTAIRCRNEVELSVTLQMLEKADICWHSGVKATNADWLYGRNCGLLIYICPPTSYSNHNMYLDWDRMNDAINGGNSPGWTYVEASDLFRNQLISMRRAKHENMVRQ